jgi:serine/threonine protein kinase
MNPDPKVPPPATDDSAVDLTSSNTSSYQTAYTPPLVPVVSHPAELEPGARLGQYRLVRHLGAGGMGIVYEAEDEWLSRRVALKVLRADLPAAQTARERFLREARAMASIEHENVCTIYQVGEADGRSYMAMQLLTGETLEMLQEREGRMPPADAARMGRQIALGLAAADEKSLVHRDVKPANVWLEAGTKRVKLLDFGLALGQDNPQLTHSGFVIGTPAFMSPEQARGEPLDGRSDLFSLGIILYLATTADRPFEGATAMAVMRNLELHFPTRVNVKRADVPAAFSNLIMELLAKDRKDRPVSAGLVAERLARPEITRPSHLPVAPPAAPVSPIAAAEPKVPGWPNPPRPPAPASSLIRRLMLLAVVSLGLAAFWYFYLSNYGRLRIDPEVVDTEVQIRQNGQLKYTSLQDRLFELRPGTYELFLVRPKSGYRLTKTIIDIRRNREEVVRVIGDKAVP